MFLIVDIIAGLTLWGLAVPEAMAYAGIAGLPPYAGLYTLLAALLVYAAFGSSRHLVVQATSATAALLAATIVVFGVTAGDPTAYQAYATAFVLVVGVLVFLVGAGNLIVAGARGIAIAFGVDEFIVGATIVAVGTSVPELATTVVAKLRGHDELGVGTILGSNIFNGIFIVAVAAIIHPITVAWREVAIALVFGLVALAFTYPSRSGLIERRCGILLLLLYAAYLATLLQRPAA